MSPQHSTAILERKPSPTKDIDWTLLSAQGRVLFYIALCPACTVQEIAVGLDLTERAVRFVLRALRRTDMVKVQRRSRRHHYRVNLDAPLLHPTIEGMTLRPVLGRLAAQAEREENTNCVRLG
ncbi:MAG: hypothetical protein WD904_00525 [Dehalococcoidia bacterium]